MARQKAWKNLQHALGAATRLPRWLTRLRADDPHDRREALVMLRERLVGDGTWYSAAPRAVSTLLDELPAAPDPALPLLLTADIIGADHHRAWLGAPGEEQGGEAREVVEAALQSRACWLEGLADLEPGARAAACVLLAMLPRDPSEDIAGVLIERAQADEEGVVRASALIALGRVGQGEARVEAFVEGVRRDETQPALVRGAAGVAWLRRDAGRSFADAAGEIEGLLSGDEKGPRLPWFSLRPRPRSLGRWHSDGPFRALLALAEQRGDMGAGALADLMVRLGAATTSGAVLHQADKVVLALGGFDHLDSSLVALPEDLSDRQRRLAEKLADAPLVPSGGYGLPKCGPFRRRWLGLDPAGPLERRVEVMLRDENVELPVWAAWRRLQYAGEGGSPVPPRLDGVLGGVGRWQAIVEVSADVYGFSSPMEETDIERELAAVAEDPDLVAHVVDVAETLSDTYAQAARRTGFPPPHVGLELSALVLLPLVRAGHVLEERWERLVHIGREDLAREVLAGFAEPRREAILLAAIDWDVGTAAINLGNHLQRMVPLIDLAPTATIARAMERRIALLESAGSDRESPWDREDREKAAKKLRKRMQKLAAVHPDLTI